jgi:hypothetical protein
VACGNDRIVERVNFCVVRALSKDSLWSVYPFVTARYKRSGANEGSLRESCSVWFALHQRKAECQFFPEILLLCNACCIFPSSSSSCWISCVRFNVYITCRIFLVATSIAKCQVRSSDVVNSLVELNPTVQRSQYHSRLLHISNRQHTPTFHPYSPHARDRFASNVIITSPC